MTSTYSTDIKANGVSISAPVYGNGTPYYRLKGNNVDYIHKYNRADMWIDTYNNIVLNAKFDALSSDCRGYYLAGQFYCTYVASYDDCGTEGTHTKTVSLHGNTKNEWVRLEVSNDNSNWETAADFHIGTNSWNYTTASAQNGDIFRQKFYADLSRNPVYYRFRFTGSSQVNLMCRTQSTLAGYHTETKTVKRAISGDTIVQTGRVIIGNRVASVLLEQEDTYSYTGPYQEY